MPYCLNCGNPVPSDATFCNKCGNKITASTPPAASPEPPKQEYVTQRPTYTPPQQPVGTPNTIYPSTPHQSNTWRNVFTGLLAVVVIVCAILAFLFISTNGKLTTANNSIVSLQGELKDTNDTLDATKTQLSSTQSSLTTTQNELTDTKTQLGSVTTQFNTSQLALTSAQNQITTLNGQLTSINGQLTTAQGTITSLQNQIAASKLKYFTNVAALTTWVNQQPLFTSSDLFGNAVNLQNLALKQGYLLFADVEADSNGRYYISCKAYCSDGYVYYILADDHDIWICQYEGVYPTP